MPPDSTTACAHHGDKLCVKVPPFVHTLGGGCELRKTFVPLVPLTCTNVVHCLWIRNSWTATAHRPHTRRGPVPRAHILGQWGPFEMTWSMPCVVSSRGWVTPTGRRANRLI